MALPSNSYTQTGASIVGLISPTYGMILDTPSEPSAKQFAVGTLGGTQTNVVSHSSTSPFLYTIKPPRRYKPLGKANPTTGIISSIPLNEHKIVTVKGVTPYAGALTAKATMTTTIVIPANAEAYDRANIRAMMSLHIGVLKDYISDLENLIASGLYQ